MKTEKNKQTTSILPCDFDGVRQLIDRIKEVSEKCDVYNRLIGAYAKNGDTRSADKAVAELMKILERWNTKRNTSTYTKAYHIDLIFHFYPGFKNKELGIEAIREDEANAAKLKDFQYRALEYLKFATRAKKFGDMKLAEEMVEKAEAIIPSIRYEKQKGGMLVHVAKKWEEFGNAKRAQALLKQSEEMLDTLKDPTDASNTLAEYYFEKGECKKGLEIFGRAKITHWQILRLFRSMPKLIEHGFGKIACDHIVGMMAKVKKFKDLAESCFKLADAQWNIGEHDLAMKTFEETLAKAKKENVAVYGLPFFFYLSHGMVERAEEFAKSSKSDPELCTALYSDIAAHHIKSKNIKEASRMLEEAEHAAATIKGSEPRLDKMLTIAFFWWKAGKPDAARAVFDEALKIKYDDVFIKGRDYAYIIEIAFFQYTVGFEKDALETAKVALEDAKKDTLSRILAYSEVVEMFVRLGDKKTVQTLFDEVLKIVDDQDTVPGSLDNHLVNFAMGLLCQKISDADIKQALWLLGE